MVGVAVSTYSTALNYTDVVRAVLLFYLAPVWSKLIEWAVLKLPWHWTSSVALVAALMGAYLVLGGEISLAALNFGDMLALVSGVAWAAGASLIFAGGKPSALSLTVVTLISTVAVTLPFAIGAGWPVLGDEGEPGRDGSPWKSLPSRPGSPPSPRPTRPPLAPMSRRERPDSHPKPGCRSCRYPCRTMPHRSLSPRWRGSSRSGSRKTLSPCCWPTRRPGSPLWPDRHSSPSRTRPLHPARPRRHSRKPCPPFR